MNDDIAKEYLKMQEEMADTLSAMITYLKRHELLIDKVCQYLPATLLEEYGEFLLDWGKCVEKLGRDGAEHSRITMKIWDEILEEIE